jgi:hypothetical protein
VKAFLDILAHFIGEIARPFAIMTTAYAAAHATIVIAGKVENGNDGAIFAGAYFLGVGTLFLGKAAEIISAGRHRRDVDVAQATGSPPGPQEVVVTNTPADPVHVEETRPATE